MSDKSTILAQKILLERCVPLLQKNGQHYKKILPVHARTAKKGEFISTITSDGLETQQQAKKGDLVVYNQTAANECYLISADKFEKLYKFSHELENGLSKYQPKGKIIALEMNRNTSQQLGLELPTHFMASWGSKMVLKPLDFLVAPPSLTKIYRIARKEFFETYRLIEND